MIYSGGELKVIVPFVGQILDGTNALLFSSAPATASSMLDMPER
jgi:hypothetical protein